MSWWIECGVWESNEENDDENAFDLSRTGIATKPVEGVDLGEKIGSDIVLSW